MLRNSKTLAGARSARVRKPPRHRVHPANREIVEMLGFVRQVTGRPHLNILAVLLQEATGDKGLSARRLAALWRDHQKRPQGWLRRFLSHPLPAFNLRPRAEKPMARNQTTKIDSPFLVGQGVPRPATLYPLNTRSCRGARDGGASL